MSEPSCLRVLTHTYRKGEERGGGDEMRINEHENDIGNRTASGMNGHQVEVFFCFLSV